MRLMGPPVIGSYFPAQHANKHVYLYIFLFANYVVFTPSDFTDVSNVTVLQWVLKVLKPADKP